MTDNTRRPGPWDTPATPQRPQSPAHDPIRDEPPLDRGQHPVVAVGGTLLFAGLIWWLTGSWVIAVALIFGLIVHEYGHVLAMNRLGMGPARIYIIPLLGGVARAQRAPRSEWDGVIVSMAGPLFGLLATIPFFALHLFGVQPPLPDPAGWLLGAFIIAMINLINLAPAPPLDGSKAVGPVLARIHPMLEVGVLLLIGAIVVVWAINRGSWIFAIFLVLALYSHLRQGVREPYGRKLSGPESVKSVGLYLATAAACIGVGLLPPTLLAGDPLEGLRAILAYLRITA